MKEVPVYSVVVSEYNEPEADDLPLGDYEDGTMMQDNPENVTRRDAHRKHLERQRSHEYDRSAINWYLLMKNNDKSKRLQM